MLQKFNQRLIISQGEKNEQIKDFSFCKAGKAGTQSF